MEYEAVIGLEIHAELLTSSKIFCGCATAFGAPPNTQVCEVCLGMPGSLPVLNKKAVEYALKMALATGCRINAESVFARKNYFYPDLPKGYQISQYELPLAEHGHLDIKVDGQTKRIGITRIHLEEDAGKLVHSESRPVSLVDFNRTGVPLIEIVSEPDMRSPEEAVEYFKGLRNILLYLEVCDGNMEEGSLRCDANISLRPRGAQEFGVKVELKNMNSFRFVKAALEFEIKRQRANLAAGREIIQETRLWDTASNQTVSMRGKEEAHDYRYFPDPDLVPVKVSDEWQEGISKSLPELPQARLARFQAEYRLPEYDAEVLTSDKALADYFEAAVKEFPQAKQVSNWIMCEVLREAKKYPDGVAALKITPAAFAALVKLIDSGAISGKQGKMVFEEMVASGRDPESIIKEKGLAQISDSGALEAAAQEIIAANPKEAADYKAGKTKVLGFFVGQLMKKTKGQANPQLANEIFQRLLQK
ncbi:MAG: Asp-tRNA(Asn)/Glu-tRNA(Gln) amidotransferase subunit GatB [Deltaproteobacteria bacterium]|nr:Asp-tRNA(Asn)/Glu-tRNA(Gln) amidotransferase subunit GatB [Deltaproteobacteria bacterium]